MRTHRNKRTVRAINTIRRGSPVRSLAATIKHQDPNAPNPMPTNPELSQALEAWVWERERVFQAFRASQANLKLRAEIGKLVYEQVPQADKEMCAAYAGGFLSDLFWKHEEWEIAMDGDKLLDFVDSIAEAMIVAQRKADRRGELYRQAHSTKDQSDSE